MATFNVILSGGPCDGTEKVLTQKQFDTGKTRCQGVTYTKDHPLATRPPTWVFVAPASSGGGGPQTPNAPHALGGWKAIRHAINKALPEALNASQKSRRAALRSLSKARKVRL